MGIVELQLPVPQLVSTKTNERMIRVPSLTSTRNIQVLMCLLVIHDDYILAIPHALGTLRFSLD